MSQRKGRGNVLMFYSLVIGLFLFGTLLGNQTVAVISEMVPMERLHRIVIDPGHGGEDGGQFPVPGKTRVCSIFKSRCA